MKKREERIDLESAQIYSWLERLFCSTYMWVSFAVIALVFFSPITLAIGYHNWRLLFLFPISLTLAVLLLAIILKIEDKYIK